MTVYFDRFANKWSRWNHLSQRLIGRMPAFPLTDIHKIKDRGLGAESALPPRLRLALRQPSKRGRRARPG